MKNQPISKVTPLLSILLPAYNYAEGTIRILSKLNAGNIAEFEILIFDNSSNDEVFNSIQRFSNTSRININYIKNEPVIDPATNWNNLLDSAAGKYSILMHHDEFPIKDDFFKELLSILKARDDIDSVILDGVLIDQKTGMNRRNLPFFLRKYLCTYFPLYIYRRNFIGATGLVVCRTDFYPRFDPKLKWLLDVDVYARMFLKCRNIHFYSSLQVGSILFRSDSLTAKLNDSIQEVWDLERAYLSKYRLHAKVWLDSDWKYKLIRFFETIFWFIFRVFYFVICKLRTQPISTSNAQSSLRHFLEKLK
jgi:glycosyltransferase involved in cell wall biosynthesis